MDKAILKKFAIESRQDLMQRMENKVKTFYIDEEFSKQQSGDVYILANSKHSLNLSKEEYTKRELLIKRINELYKKVNTYFCVSAIFLLSAFSSAILPTVDPPVLRSLQHLSSIRPLRSRLQNFH